MRYVILFLIFMLASASADILDDLRSIDIPVNDVVVTDSVIFITMDGLLVEGDSLLKHYGGVFFTVIDSIAMGWEIRGLQVEISEAVLVFRLQDMISIISLIASSTESDDAIADWILSRTRVFPL
ncbi:MAG: hypothetical protein H8D05_01390 [FCB group bacterium]|nr:hypothetical protein [FCB group bacterium]